MLVMLMTALWKNVKCQKVLWVRRNLKRVMLRVYSILSTSLLTGFPLKATAAPQALWRLTWPRRCCAALKRSTPSCSMGLMAVPNEPTCRYTDIYGQIKTNWISLRHFENPFVDLDVQNCLHVKSDLWHDDVIGKNWACLSPTSPNTVTNKISYQSDWWVRMSETELPYLDV